METPLTLHFPKKAASKKAASKKAATTDIVRDGMNLLVAQQGASLNEEAPDKVYWGDTELINVHGKSWVALKQALRDCPQHKCEKLHLIETLSKPKKRRKEKDQPAQVVAQASSSRGDLVTMGQLQDIMSNGIIQIGVMLQQGQVQKQQPPLALQDAVVKKMQKETREEIREEMRADYRLDEELRDEIKAEMLADEELLEELKEEMRADKRLREEIKAEMRADEELRDEVKKEMRAEKRARLAESDEEEEDEEEEESE